MIISKTSSRTGDSACMDSSSEVRMYNSIRYQSGFWAHAKNNYSWGMRKQSYGIIIKSHMASEANG